MEFKASSASFETKKRFSNDMKRFINEEAARFTTDSNEAASASIDDIADKSFRISASKNKGKAKEQGEILKGLKEEKRSKSKNGESGKVSKDRFTDPLVDTSKSEFQKTSKDLQQSKFVNESSKVSKDKFEGTPSVDKNGMLKKESTQKSETKDTPKTEKEAKKALKKEQKKAASKTAVASMFRAKKEMSNDLVREKISGDALKDGNSGLLRIATEYLNPMRYVKSMCAKIGMAILPYILGFMAVSAVVIIIVSFLFSVLQPIKEVGDALNNFIGIFTGDGNSTFVNAPFSEDEIEKIIEKSGADETQKKVLHFALSKVGFPYSQDLRTSGKAYDCSSLAYYSWDEAGVDISYGTRYPPTAAEGARMLKEDKKALSTMDLKPGDLIFYGGEANGRYIKDYDR